MTKDIDNTDNSYEVSIPVEYVNTDYDDIDVQNHIDSETSDTDIEFE